MYREHVERDPWERARQPVQAQFELERRVAAAIAREARKLGLTESEFVNGVLLERLGLEAFDRIRSLPNRLPPDEATELAYQELEAMRTEEAEAEDDDDEPRA